jgi:pimeloyl-ACP methyl ester carboxylesterase
VRRGLLALAVFLGLAAPAAAASPPLATPEATLRAALQCTPGLAGGGPEPVLLVPGTTLTPRENFSWSYQRALDAQGRPYCTVELPNHAMSDIQVSAEYVVYALRTMHATTGGRIAYLGFSQGGMIGRWALKYWPETRAMVDDYVGLDPSNHGTLDAYPVCAAGCAPSIWQQQTGSHFLRALNTGPETFAGIDYTVAYSRTDEVVTPNLDARGSSSLRSGDGAIANVAVQEICPLDLSEHLAMGTYDPVGYALFLDAITHPGPASKARISRAVCARLFLPGVQPSTFATNFANVGLTAGQQILTYPHASREPALAPYAAT